MAEKKKMAYDNGALQTKVANLEAQLDELRAVEEEKRKLQNRVESFGSEQAELQMNWSRMDGDLKSTTSELHKAREELEMSKTKLAITEDRLIQVRFE